MPGGLVPQITNSGPSKSLYAPAGASGGGGGGGSISTFNQIFTSSIGATNPGQNVLLIAGAGANMAIDMSSDTLANIAFQLSTSINGSGGGNAPSIACYDLGGNSYSLVLGGSPAGVPVATTISSLSVSSINGVAPAGGGVSPAGISTNAVSAATGTKLILNGSQGISIDAAGSTTFNTPQLNAPTCDLQISSINGAAPGSAPPAIVSTIVQLKSLSTINSEAAPASANYNVGDWLAFGAISGGWGTFNGKIPINQAGGAINSTFQIPPIVYFSNTPFMNAFVSSRAVGVGGLNDVAAKPVNESSITVTATVTGTVDELAFLVVGPAATGFYPGF